MLRGKVKWFNNSAGYGFIVPNDGGSDVMVHSKILRPVDAENLKPGTNVTFTLEPGRMRAATCQIILYELWELPKECSHRFALKLDDTVMVFSTLQDVIEFHNVNGGGCIK